MFDLYRKASLYEWEHPTSPSAMMMWIAAVPVVFFIGNAMMYLFKTDKGFAEIQKMIEIHIVETEESNVIFEAKDNKFSRNFTWKKENGKLVFPKNLSKFQRSKYFKIESVNSYKNPEGKDVLFVVEKIPGTEFEEVFVKVRTQSGSDRFIVLPTILLEMKEKMIEHALKKKGSKAIANGLKNVKNTKNTKNVKK